MEERNGFEKDNNGRGLGKPLVVIMVVVIVIIATISIFGFLDQDRLDALRDYRQDMRDFVQNISAYVKGFDPGFLVIPQNGHELLTENGTVSGVLVAAYMNAIDGVGREDLFYGYDGDNIPTPTPERDNMTAFMDLAEGNGIEVLVTDYCWTQSLMNDSYQQNDARGYISFAANHRELDNFPSYPSTPYNSNLADINSLAEAKNFLYLLNPKDYETQADFASATMNTNYDVLIIDSYFDTYEPLTAETITSMKVKANGGTRLVIAYMSIGEAENYRYYWEPEWNNNPPSWLAEYNVDEQENFKVRYWNPSWQDIIFGNSGSYLKRILDAGFDGVYLDIIDAFEYFEEQ